jgi:HD superfamily phosphohydrolase
MEREIAPFLKEAGAEPEMTAAIVDEELPDRGSREVRFFRGLLSGVLDPDKLDYLNRDAFFCGVPYGIQDSDFILRRVVIDEDDRLGVDGRGIMSIEGLLFSKYLMYRAVYWHKSVRAATAMIKKALVLALGQGVLAGPELYGLDDAGFFRLLASRDFEPFSLARDVAQGRLFRPILDIPFDSERPLHASLLDLAARCRVEEEVARILGSGGPACGSLDIVIDIPEAVSFESDMPILGDDGSASLPFTKSATVFSPDLIAGFARSLRRLRIFRRETGAGTASAPEMELLEYFS